MNLSINLIGEQASFDFAKILANVLKPPLILTFSGEIGAGKTTIIRALLKAIGITGAIKSPTFSIVESYIYNNINFNHFDLYRINDPVELEFIGFREYFNQSAITLIEWPERLQGDLQVIDLAFSLIFLNDNSRQLKIISKSDKGYDIVTYLKSVAQ